jgi:hypothetical protein
MSRRLKRRALLGLLFAALCVLALIGVVIQALGGFRAQKRSRIAPA